MSGERYRETETLHSKWPMVELGEVCTLVRGVTYKKEDEVAEGGYKVLRANNIDRDHSILNLSDVKQVSVELQFPDEKKLGKGDILICLASGSKEHIGKVALIKDDTALYIGGFMGAIRCESHSLHPAYLFHQLRMGTFNAFLREQIAGANINNLRASTLYRYKIPLPPLSVQREIVAEIEAEQKLVEANRELIERMEKKVQAALARVWGE